MALPIKINRILETEEELGVVFPAVFKMRMSVQNGGTVLVDDEYWELYPFLDRTDRRTISRSSQDIRYHTREAMTRIGFPADGIAIAHDSASDLLFLRRKGGDLGPEVWRFDGYSGEAFQILDDVGELWEPGHPG